MRESSRIVLNAKAVIFRTMPVADGPVAPEWLHMVPGGQLAEGRDGRAYPNLTPENVVAAFNSHGADIPIDWEHSTEHKAPKGERAPAAGWMTKAEMRNDGTIWCSARWTDEGARSVSSGEYRYISPVFWVDDKTGNILAIKSAGLVNEPNLRLTALNRQETDPMTSAIAKKLELKDDATEAEIEAALDKLLAERSSLRVETNRLKTVAPLPDQFIPRADFDVVLNRAQNAEAAIAKRAVDDREIAINSALSQALTDGKITPATQEHYRDMMAQSPDGLAAFQRLVKAMNRIAPDSGISGAPPTSTESGADLTKNERDVCRIIGISPEAFKATKLAEQAR